MTPLQDDWGGHPLGTSLPVEFTYGRSAFSFELMQFTPGGLSVGVLQHSFCIAHASISICRLQQADTVNAAVLITTRVPVFRMQRIKK